MSVYSIGVGSEVRNLKNKKFFRDWSDSEREAELNKRFLIYVSQIEKDKLYYFTLAYANPQNVLLVNSPEDTKELKQFRGYDWNGAKGNEGIKYNGGDTVDNIITPLFDPLNRYNTEKINYYIQQNFIGNEIRDEPENLFKSYRLIDLLRFKDRKFDKRIWLSTEQTLTVESKWELVKLESVCEIVRGASPRPIDKYITEDPNGVNWIKIGDVNENDKYITKTAEKITREGADRSRFVNPGDFILSNSMSFGRPYILKVSGCIHDGWLLMTKISEKLDKDYLYEILSYEDTQKQFAHSAAGGIVKNLNTGRAKATKIPLPPIDIQIKIVKDIEEFEENKNQYLKDGISIKDYEKFVKEKKNDIMKKHLSKTPLHALLDKQETVGVILESPKG